MYFFYTCNLLRTHNILESNIENKLRMTARIIFLLFDLCMISKEFLWSQNILFVKVKWNKIPFFTYNSSSEFANVCNLFCAQFCYIIIVYVILITKIILKKIPKFFSKIFPIFFKIFTSRKTWKFNENQQKNKNIFFPKRPGPSTPRAQRAVPSSQSWATTSDNHGVVAGPCRAWPNCHP